MVNVYKVYDSEFTGDWSDIMGSGQLEEFATDQLTEYINTNSNEEIDEDMKNYIDEIKFIVYYRLNNGVLPHTLSDKQAIELLSLRGFDVEKLNIY